MIKTIKLLQLFLLIIMSSFFLSSCGSDSISRLRSLCEIVEEDGSNFTVEDWEGVVEEYNDIKEEMSNERFTQDEMKEIGRLEARLFVKGGSKFGGAYMRNFKSEMEGIAEEINNTDLEQVMKEEGLDELFK